MAETVAKRSGSPADAAPGGTAAGDAPATRERRAPGSGRRGPSMADVAKAAGVSGQTVSRVANGRANVDAATRDRVLSAMREVGYRPNSAARALRNGQFRTIGVIMADLSSVGNARTLDAVASAAGEADYSISLMPLRATTERGVLGAIDRLGSQAVDGVIVLLEQHDLDSRGFDIPHEMPVVVVDSEARPGSPTVDSDQTGGAAAATRHLLELGHRTVWHIAGPAGSYAAERREQAWRQTLQEAGADVPPVVRGDWTAATGYDIGRHLVRHPDLTAVFSANDQMALGVLRALHEAGLRVPGDVSVVGFDDIPEAGSFWPPLTTVRQSFDRVGRVAVDLLVAEIESGRSAVKVPPVRTELVVRASTGPRRRRVTRTPG